RLGDEHVILGAAQRALRHLDLRELELALRDRELPGRAANRAVALGLLGNLLEALDPAGELRRFGASVPQGAEHGDTNHERTEAFHLPAPRCAALVKRIALSAYSSLVSARLMASLKSASAASSCAFSRCAFA